MSSLDRELKIMCRIDTELKTAMICPNHTTTMLPTVLFLAKKKQLKYDYIRLPGIVRAHTHTHPIP